MAGAVGTAVVAGETLGAIGTSFVPAGGAATTGGADDTSGADCALASREARKLKPEPEVQTNARASAWRLGLMARSSARSLGVRQGRTFAREFRPIL